ncbi:unnamed protein product, partial [Allacma fusca]
MAYGDPRKVQICRSKCYLRVQILQ